MSKLMVLMYHKVRVPPANARHRGNYVRPDQFAEQLDALLSWGYRTITFDQWLAYREGRIAIPRRPMIITFDDGYRCFDEVAWPLLRERAMQATVFLVAGQIGGTNAWDADELREPLLDTERILNLQREGVRFGSHTFTHPALAKIPAPLALDEMRRSREALEDLLATAVTVLSYPYSNQNRAVRALARAAGYRACVRGRGRMNFRHTDVHALRRIKPELRTSVRDLRRTLIRARWLQLD
jgi:peptidoglycan/xylan/chitin deacetylase (PgdA/CDA1 family)